MIILLNNSIFIEKNKQDYILSKDKVVIYNKF